MPVQFTFTQCQFLAINQAYSTDSNPRIFLFSLKGFCKGRHEEEEQFRGHIVALSDSYSLWEFNNFLLNFEDNSKILVSAFNG